MYSISEEELDKAYQHIEQAVFMMAQPNDNIKVNQKYEVIENL